jgi:hypothetical protein
MNLRPRLDRVEARFVLLRAVISGNSRASYSSRSVVIGSPRVARRAGIHVAANATAPSSSGVTINAKGSHAFTPNRKLARKRVSHNEPLTPMIIPMRASAIPCPRTMLRMCEACRIIGRIEDGIIGRIYKIHNTKHCNTG